MPTLLTEIILSEGSLSHYMIPLCMQSPKTLRTEQLQCPFGLLQSYTGLNMKGMEGKQE